MKRLALLALLAAACGSKRRAYDDAPPPPPVDAAVVVAPPVDAAPAPPARTEHAVYSLVDNRHAAHRRVDGDLVLDASDIGFARYIRFGVPAPRWHLGQIVDGKRTAVADKLATLEVPFANADDAARISLVTALVRGEPKQHLSLKVNGRRPGKDAQSEIAGRWQLVMLPVEPGYFKAGENELVLETTGGKQKLAFEWIRFGTNMGDGDPRPAATFDPTGAIALAKDAALTWYITVPDGADLVADVPAPCRVEVRARAGDESFAGGLLGADAPRVELSRMAGKVVALTLLARECPIARIANPRITVHGPAPALLPAAPPPKYIIVWVMDALRADKLPVFTPGARSQTPNFEELARSSAVFRQYYVQGNESQTSHSSMWTGVYPAVHNVRLAGTGGTWKLSPKLDAIAPQLAAAGYATLAVTGNGFVNEDGGYARGFAEFRNMMRETGIDNNLIYGQVIVDAALKKLDAHRDQPAYLFLGTIDTHGPWVARKPWIDIYSPGPYHGPFQEFGTAKDLGFKPGSMGCSIIPPPEDVERLRAIYDSAVSYHDQQLGRLVAQLKSWGIWDETMLIVTADHGEELFEDIRCGHGGSLRDSLERVPLLVHDPSRFPGGTILDEGAEAVDLLPTILTAVGAEVPAQVQGAPLEALAQGFGRGWARASYASMYEYAHAMRIGRWKIRVGKAGAPIIGDLVADPGEQHDFVVERPVERRMLTDNLGLFLALRAQWKKTAWGPVTAVTAAGAKALDEASTR